MKLSSRLVALLLMMLIVFPAAACAPCAEVELPSTPEPTVSATAVPTATPTPTASPVPTPTPIFSDARMAELNQQFQDFLNKQGEFTLEKMPSIMMVTISSLDTISPLDDDKVGLGIADGQPTIQGYFFDYFEKDNRLFLLMGFDGKDGNRFITPLEIPLYIYEVIEIEGLTFPVTKLKENYICASTVAEDHIDYGERAKLIPLLDAIEGKVIGFTFQVTTYSKEGLKEDDEISRIVGAWLDEVNSKVDLSFGLFQLVTSNDIEYDWEDRIGDNDSIVKIKNSDDIIGINISDVPIIKSIRYFAVEDK